MSSRMEDDSPRCATCPACGTEAEWRDIEGHPDGGEWFCPLGCSVERRAAKGVGMKASFYTPTLNGKPALLAFSTFSGYVLKPVKDLSEATFFKNKGHLQRMLKDLSSRHADDVIAIVPARIEVEA